MDREMQRYEFPWPDSEKGYNLFPQQLEDDPNVLFHGTAAENFDAIVNEGFKSAAELGSGTDPDFKLSSISYAKSSNQSLAHVCQIRDKGNGGDYVVFAVEFVSIQVPGIRNNPIDIHVDNPNIKPTIIGYCEIPSNYVFR
ncbi:MAG: hypothetical protein HGB11_07245 [Chlorobiales bacterium]|nr:hypothetical protein [Chlorobiales bacterium]